MIVELHDTTTNAIAKELVTLRDEGGAIALGRVLTLIIVTRDQDAEEAIDAANEASREHPCRVLVLARQSSGPSGLDAQIRVGGDAGASEVVVLRLRGELVGHGDTVITPLLLPDAPIVAWWPREFPQNPAADPIGRIAHRRITDSASCADPGRALADLRVVHRPGDTDLTWTRMTQWRAVLAAALDQPPFGPVHHAIVVGPEVGPSTDLLAAWLAEALGCPVERRAIDGADGVIHVALERRVGDVLLERPSGERAILTQPGQPVRHLTLPHRSLRDCLAEELRRLDADEVYHDVLVRGLPKIGLDLELTPISG